MSTLISGSANKPLARKISEISNLSYSDTELSVFPNQELKVRVSEIVPETYLLQSFSDPVNSNIIEFLLLADAAHRLTGQQLTGIIPWFGYSKQDKVFLPGEPLSAKVIAKILQTGPIKKIISVELHNPSISGYFDIPVINLSAMSLFADYLKTSIPSNSIVVSPDAGAIKTTTRFADELGLEVAHISKKRDLDTGQVSVAGIDRNIANQAVIMLDDMIATGSTLIETTTFLAENGASSITVCATHHLYIDGVQDKLDQAPIDKLIVTDSIQMPDKLKSAKLTQLSIAELIANSL